MMGLLTTSGDQADLVFHSYVPKSCRKGVKGVWKRNWKLSLWFTGCLTAPSLPNDLENYSLGDSKRIKKIKHRSWSNSWAPLLLKTETDAREKNFLWSFIIGAGGKKSWGAH